MWKTCLAQALRGNFQQDILCFCDVKALCKTVCPWKFSYRQQLQHLLRWARKHIYQLWVPYWKMMMLHL